LLMQRIGCWDIRSLAVAAMFEVSRVRAVAASQDHAAGIADLRCATLRSGVPSERSKVDRWFSSDEAFANVRVDVGVGLKADPQATLGGASSRACSKRSIRSSEGG
jgi:hypothetical protein